MSANHNFHDRFPLRKVESFWGDIFTGTKAQLNAAGFGLGCAFPGEPKAPKKRCSLPLAHGYKKVEVMVEWTSEPQSARPFAERTFDVRAYHLATDRFDLGKRIQFAPGVKVSHANFIDSYMGAAQALIQAGLIEDYQLPGMPGCGKCTTTFDTDGKIFKRGSAHWIQPGFKVVRKYGNTIEVSVVVATGEREARIARYQASQSAYVLECLKAKREAQAFQNASGTRPSLRLVWSA